MTGVILSGGKSTRMGTNKAFLEIKGERLIDRTVRLFKDLFDEVIVVTNDPLSYLGLDVTIVSDIIKDKGSLGGIYSGLFYASSIHAFIAACDMPYLNKKYIGYMIKQIAQNDIVVPEKSGWMEPLHAIYSKNCLPPIKNLLMRNELKTTGFYKGLKVLIIPEETTKEFDPLNQMFVNVNTQEELELVKTR